MYRKSKHIHFVGIGGIGMSGIAELLLNLGYKRIHVEKAVAEAFADGIERMEDGLRLALKALANLVSKDSRSPALSPRRLRSISRFASGKWKEYSVKVSQDIIKYSGV